MKTMQTTAVLWLFWSAVALADGDIVVFINGPDEVKRIDLQADYRAAIVKTIQGPAVGVYKDVHFMAAADHRQRVFVTRERDHDPTTHRFLPSLPFTSPQGNITANLWAFDRVSRIALWRPEKIVSADIGHFKFVNVDSARARLAGSEPGLGIDMDVVSYLIDIAVEQERLAKHGRK